LTEEKELKVSIGEMIALVVHDLRNPVATISANLSFIRDVAGVEDPDAIEEIGRAHV
jgi:signal transduction histidine kinase